MKKIRKGVFETNSSSTHSISLSNDKDLRYHIKKANNKIVLDTIPEEDGVCYIYPGAFEWEEQTYNDAATKASYCLTWIKTYRNKKEYLDMLKRVIKRVNKSRIVKFVKQDNEYYPWGNIDHQSDDVCEPVFRDEESLENFIFNSKSILRTDNDNH